MKQVMSPMTGREGEQTPSEESNTLREIDRLFSIISSEQLLISWTPLHSDHTYCVNSRESLSEELNNPSTGHARSKIRSLVGC